MICLSANSIVAATSDTRAIKVPPNVRGLAWIDWGISCYSTSGIVTGIAVLGFTATPSTASTTDVQTNIISGQYTVAIAGVGQYLGKYIPCSIQLPASPYSYLYLYQSVSANGNQSVLITLGFF